MITDKQHRIHIRKLPKSSFRKTQLEVLELCRAPIPNKSLLEAKLNRALLRLRRENFYLGVKIFRACGPYRLMFIDPSNRMVLWLKNEKHHTLHWFPLYGDGSYPSIL
jgi:hypothetical protein